MKGGNGGVTKGAGLEEHGGEVVGVLGDPGLLLGEAVARGLVRVQVLEVLQVRVLAVHVGLRVVPCEGGGLINDRISGDEGEHSRGAY